MSPHSLMNTPPELLQRAMHDVAVPTSAETGERRLAGWLCIVIMAAAVVTAML